MSTSVETDFVLLNEDIYNVLIKLFRQTKRDGDNFWKKYWFFTLCVILIAAIQFMGIVTITKSYQLQFEDAGSDGTSNDDILLHNFWAGLFALIALSVYIVSSVSSSIFVIVLPKFNSEFKNCAINALTTIVSYYNITLSYLSWMVAIRYMTYWNDDYSKPINLILNPISIVFVLEIDDWAVRLISMSLCCGEKIKNNDDDFFKIKTTKKHSCVHTLLMWIFLSTLWVSYVVFWAVQLVKYDGEYATIYFPEDGETFFSGHLFISSAIFYVIFFLVVIGIRVGKCADNDGGNQPSPKNRTLYQ